MRKAAFSGISILDPSDPITIDGASFQSTDRETIDRFLEVGAVTHRHDAHASLSDPASVASAWTEASGGAIRANQPIYIGYTLEDADGGETLISQVVNVTTPAPYDQPGDPMVGSADYAAGQLIADTYYYGITLIDGEGGETPLGPILTVERSPGFASGQIRLGGLAQDLSADAVAWRLYRAIGGGDWYLLSQGTSDLYTDDGTAAADPSQKPPENDALNTTNRTNRLKVVLPSAEPGLGSAAAIRLYLSGDGLFGNPSLYQRLPVGSAGQVIPIPSIALQPGAPPDVSTAIGGASQIDPDTDILDWHWKRPVAASGALGSGSGGDVRMVLDQDWPWVVPGASAAVAADWEPMMPSREVSFFAASGALASGAVYVGSAAMREDWQLIAVQTNKPARVRLYAKSSKQGTDKNRSLDADPVGNHGVLLDLVTETGELLWLLSPQVHGSSLETVPTKMIPISVTNLDVSGVVEVSLTYLPG